MRCSPGTRRVLQGRVPRAPKRTRPPALRRLLLRGTCIALRLCVIAQRRRALRRACRPTPATQTRRRARRRSRRRVGRTLPTRRVRAMRSMRPAFPHCPHSPSFSSRHPLPLAALHSVGPSPRARDGTARAGSTMATVVLPGTPTVLGTPFEYPESALEYPRGHRWWSPGGCGALEGLPGCSGVLTMGAARVTGVHRCGGTAEGRACGAVVRRRVRLLCRGQQRVPGGLRADRDRGGVPHRRRRRGQDVCCRGGQLYRPAGLLLPHHQQCVVQHARGRRRQLLLAAAVRRCRHHRCAAIYMYVDR